MLIISQEGPFVIRKKFGASAAAMRVSDSEQARIALLKLRIRASSVCSSGSKNGFGDTHTHFDLVSILLTNERVEKVCTLLLVEL